MAISPRWLSGLRLIAERHNVRVWREPEARVVCTSDTCDNACLMPASYAHHCQDCGAETRITDTGALSWWWETCSPGCLPDSDVSGPFDGESEALQNATDGLDSDDAPRCLVTASYVPCACRDCMDTTIASVDADGGTEPTLCHDCERAGCDDTNDAECCRSDAYGASE